MTNKNYQIDTAPAKFEHNFNWASTTPLGFLNSLTKHPGTVVYVPKSPEGWLGSAHIDGLMRVIDSKQPTAIICWFVCPHAPLADAQSTLGNEAAIMVEAFRLGHGYPSSCSNLRTIDKNALKQWWHTKVEVN